MRARTGDDGRSTLRGASMSRPTRFVAGAAAAGVALTAIATAGAGSAGAATPVRARAVGNFLDAAVNGQPIDKLVALDYATAKAPGSTSAQNPLKVSLLGQALPLPELQLPGAGALSAGILNQVAQARTDGLSFGGSGAISNQGGIAIGGGSGQPTSASLDLSAADVTKLLGGSLPTTSIPGLPSLPGLPDLPGLSSLPGLTSLTGILGGATTSGAGNSTLASLGGIKASIGAVSALAQTRSGGRILPTKYGIGSLKLTVASPALGSVVSTLTGLASPTALTSLLKGLPDLPAGGVLPPDCKLTAPTDLSKPISLENGAVVISPTGGSIGIDLVALLRMLKLDIDDLPANTDLIAYLIKDLPTVLTKGLEGLVDGLVSPLEDAFTACASALPGVTELAGLLDNGKSPLERTVNGLAATLGTATSSGAKTLTDALAKALQIGVNVQPNGRPGTYASPLAATAKQGTPIVRGQSIVRAIEIDLGGGAGTLPLPGVSSLPLGSLVPNSAGEKQLAGPHQASTAAAGSALSIALGNAAAGPSTAPPSPNASRSPTPVATAPSTAIPTGVPAGMGRHGGSPVLPVVLGLLGLAVLGGGVFGLRTRGRFSR